LLEVIGSEYGGKYIMPSLIGEKSTIITCGVGEDITFNEEMNNRFGCYSVGVDPTIKSWNYIETEKSHLHYFKLIKKALWKNNDIIKLHKNVNPNWVSESIFAEHNAAGEDTHDAETITIPELLDRYLDVSVLSLDIEGAEFEIIMSLNKLEVPQVVIEFHHFCCREKTIKDTETCLRKMNRLGYEAWFQRDTETFLKEVTFIHNNAM
jgi:FkbM family methyltransferase